MRNGIMKKGLVFSIVLLFFGASFTLDFNTTVSASNGNIIYVDDDADFGWYDATHVKTIQEGIDNASADQIVYVYNGTYSPFEITKSPLDIIGESNQSVIIEGEGNIGYGDAIGLSSENWVNISNLCMRNISGTPVYAIAMTACSHINISNCIIDNITGGHNVGIYVVSTDNLTLFNNVIRNINGSSTSSFGIDFNIHVSNSEVVNNYVSARTMGIKISGHQDNTDNDIRICGNLVEDAVSNEGYGISVYRSNNFLVSNNRVNNCRVGINIRGENAITNGTISSNVISNSISYGIRGQDSDNVNVYGNSMLTYRDTVWIGGGTSNWIVYENPHLEAVRFNSCSNNVLCDNNITGRVSVTHAHNITIENNDIRNCYGIDIISDNTYQWITRDILIANNTIENITGENNDNAIDVWRKYTSNVTIHNNTINNVAGDNCAILIDKTIKDIIITDNEISNVWDGICLGYSFSGLINATIHNNTIENTTENGIYIGKDCSGEIFENKIIDGKYGIYCQGTIHALRIYRNSVIDCEDPTQRGIWGEGDATWYSLPNPEYPGDSPYLGNYYDDYVGEDANGDGVGDTPYRVGIGVTDDYPLINMYPFGANFKYYVSENVTFNSTIYHYHNITISSYIWDLGDSTFKYIPNFTHKYTTPGFYNISLTVVDANGKSETITKEVLVNNKPVVSNEIPINNSEVLKNTTMGIDVYDEDEDTMDVSFYMREYSTGNTWVEDFDTYATDSSLHGQGGWAGWDNNPGATAYVTDENQDSSPHSLKVSGSTDIVQEFSITEGIFSLSAMTYVDSLDGGTSYFILLSKYEAGGSKDWVSQVEFRTSQGLYETRHGDSTTLILDKWVELRFIINLEDDLLQIYYNNILFSEYSYSGYGYFSTFEAVDLYAGSGTYYVDNIIFEPYHVDTYIHTVPNVLSGASANFILESFYPIKSGQTYHWYTTVYDGKENITGPIWTFNTPTVLEVYVDDDFDEATPGWHKTRYNTIQDAIENVSAGGTVYVSSGTYKDTVVYDEYYSCIIYIDKKINIIGENRDTVILDAEYDYRKSVIKIVGNGVTISNMTMKNTSIEDYLTAGITIAFIQNTSIYNCKFIDNEYQGVWTYECVNTTIRDNYFCNPKSTWDIYSYSGYNIIENNIFQSHTSQQTLGHLYLHNDSILRNNVLYNKSFSCQTNLIIENNTFFGVGTGLLIYDADAIIQVINTTVNGKPVYLYENMADIIVPSDANQVIMINCTNMTITGLTTDSVNPISIINTSNSTIADNILTDASYGIMLRKTSNYNHILRNNIENVKQTGLYIDYNSHCKYNRIARNNFHQASTESNNKVVADYSEGQNPSLNYWNDTYPTGGNWYWDKTGNDLFNGPNQDIVGSDGMHDTVHQIIGSEGGSATATDYYPLYYRYGEPNFNWTYSMISSKIVDFNVTYEYNYDGYTINYTWDFGDNTYGYQKNITHEFPETGYYKVTLTLLDNRSSSSSLTYTIPVNYEPLVISGSPNNTLVSRFTELTVNISDPDNDPINISYYLGEEGSGGGIPSDYLFYDENEQTGQLLGYVAAIKFTPTELAGSEGQSILSVMVHDAGQTSNGFVIEIYADGTDSDPGTLTTSQTISAQNGVGWQEYILDTPVEIDTTKTIWIVVDCEAGSGNGVIALDEGATDYKGDLVTWSRPDYPWYSMKADFSYDYNWMVRAGIGYLMSVTTLTSLETLPGINSIPLTEYFSPEQNTSYNWWIQVNDSASTVKSQMWNFTLLDNEPPQILSEQPANNSNFVDTNPYLQVEVSDYENDPIDISFYINSEYLITEKNASSIEKVYLPDYIEIDHDTDYFWYVTVDDGNTNLTGPTWTFHTNSVNISNIMHTPLNQEASGYVNISCTVSTNVSISEVWINITGPTNYTAVNQTMQDGYYFNTTYSIFGTYTYSIWALDSLGVSSKSAPHYFWIVPVIKTQELNEGENTVDTTEEADTNISVNVTKTTNITLVRYQENPYPETPPPPDDMNKFINVTVEDETAVIWPINITIYYTQQDLDNLSLTEDQLIGIYFYNDTTEQWELYNKTGVNTTYNISGYEGYCWAEVWHLTPIIIGCQNIPPDTPISPFPAEYASEINIDIVLSWQCTDFNRGDILVYDMYFGSTSTPPLVAQGLSAESYNPGLLAYETTYYWQIVAFDKYGASTLGPLWSFSTQFNNPPAQPNSPYPADEAINIDLKVEFSWICSDPENHPLEYDVYFGIISSPPLVQNDLQETTYSPGILNFGTTYYWKIVARDSHGKSTESPLWIFTTYVNDPPTIPINLNPPVGENNVDINTNLSWTCSDPNNDPVTYKIYFGTTTSPNLVAINYPDTSYNPGVLEFETKYYWKIVAYDNYGKLTAGSLWSFTTRLPNLPPIAKTDGPFVGYEGSEVTFNASNSTDPDGDILLYRWDYDNDGTWDTEYSTNYTSSHTWQDDYIGTIVVEVYDGEYNDTDSAQITINNVAPSVEAGPNQTVKCCTDIVSFFGSFNDPGNLDTHNIEWDFGDGTTTTGTLKPTHIYYTIGNYTVTLTVSDNDGEVGTDTLNIEVIQKYGLWANSTQDEKAIKWSGSKSKINGHIHSNDGIDISGSKNTINGIVYYVTKLEISGSSNKYNSTEKFSVTSYPISYDIFDYQPGGMEAVKAQNDGKYHYIDGDLEISSSNVALDGLYYVTGIVKLSGKEISGIFTIVAEGNVEISGSKHNYGSYCKDLLFFSTGNLFKLSGSENSLDGITYVPDGEIELSGSKNTIAGSIFGNTIMLSVSELTINS